MREEAEIENLMSMKEERKECLKNSM